MFIVKKTVYFLECVCSSRNRSLPQQGMMTSIPSILVEYEPFKLTSVCV